MYIVMKESMDKALKFSKLEERLSGLCRPLSSLYLLYQLSATQKFTFIPPTPALMHNNNSSNSSLPTAVPSQPTTTLFSAGEITSHTFNNSHTILPSQMSRLSFTVNQSSDKQQQLDSGYMSHNQTTHEKSIKANPLKSVKPSAGFVGDGIILNDLLFVFQGSDGQFIRWNAHKQAYYIDPKVIIT